MKICEKNCFKKFLILLLSFLLLVLSKKFRIIIQPLLTNIKKVFDRKINKGKKLKVGVIGLDHHNNVGNNILKYAM